MDKKRRAFVFTLNNYTPEEVEEIKGWLCYYLSFGKEVGEVEHTPHLQGYVYFENAKTLSALKKKYSSRANWAPAEATPKRASDYTKKGEQTKAEWEAQKEKGPNFGKNADVFEKGTLPLSQIEKGDKGKRKFEEAYQAYKEQRYEEMGKFALNMKQFDYLDAKVKKRDQPVPKTLEGEVKHMWFYGPPGTGKSRRARELYPEAYIKDPKNAWWDGYNGQEVVIIDDFDKYQVKQSGDLKRWLDRYPFKAEVKGGYLGDIRPKLFIITSNYQPKECWEREDVTLPAIQRRVELTHFPAMFAQPDPPSPNRFTSLPSRFQ